MLYAEEISTKDPCMKRKSVVKISFFSYGSTALYGPRPPRFVEVS
jgi:hypothetical protein